MLGRVAGATGVATVDQHSTALGSRKVELKIAIGLWEGTSPQAGHLYKFIYINYISSRTSSNIKHDLPLRSIDGFSTLASCIVIPCGDRLSHSIRRRPKKSIRNLTVLPKKRNFLEGLSLNQPNWIILRFDYSCFFYMLIPVAHPTPNIAQNHPLRDLYGDGSKPWYLVNPKIAGIYGCSSH